MTQKGDYSYPTHYRDLLEHSKKVVVLTIDIEEHCILSYPLVIWEDIEKELAGLLSFDPVVRRVQCLLIGYVTDVEIDDQGWVLVPTVLREYTQNLSRSGFVVALGSPRHILICILRGSPVAAA